MASDHTTATSEKKPVKSLNGQPFRKSTAMGMMVGLVRSSKSIHLSSLTARDASIGITRYCEKSFPLLKAAQDSVHLE